MRPMISLACWFVAATSARPASGQVIRLTETTAADLRGLDRARTAVIIPGGIFEEHGPYLPVYSDGFLNQLLTDSLARAIAARPGWTALVFPPIPLGNSGANDIGGKFAAPGTYAVRLETLRSVFMDLADELGEQGFRWVFVVHLHGAPGHNCALDQASDYFQATFGGEMVHLAGLLPIFAALDGPKTAAEREANGFSVHGGLDETSLILSARPDLVRTDFVTAPDERDSTMTGLIRLARRPDWPGYFGAPRLATRTHGERVASALVDSAVAVANRILEGASYRAIPRAADVLVRDPAVARVSQASRRAEAARSRRHEAFLRGR